MEIGFGEVGVMQQFEYIWKSDIWIGHHVFQQEDNQIFSKILGTSPENTWNNVTIYEKLKVRSVLLQEAFKTTFH